MSKLSLLVQAAELDELGIAIDRTGQLRLLIGERDHDALWDDHYWQTRLRRLDGRHAPRLVLIQGGRDAEPAA
jgi:hypothetical protein